MKKSTLLLYIVLAVLLLTACNDEKTYRIAVSQCSIGNWRFKVNDEMLAAQHLFQQDVKVEIINCYDNSEVQCRQIDSLADSGIDLLVVAPNEYSEVAPALKRTKQKGIPVILFDRKAETDDYTAFIGGNNVAVGEQSANYALLLAMQTECRSILEIAALQSTSPARDRHRGFEQVMRNHPEVDYRYIIGDWDDNHTCATLLKEIKEGRVPDVVFCHSDFMAMGAHRAVAEAQLEDKVKIIGVDGLPGPNEGIEAVQKGWFAGTCVYPTHGEKIVRLALDILTGKPYQRENILRGMMVTPENVDLVDVNERELMEQGAHMITINDKLEDYFGLYNTQRKLLVASLVTILLLVISVVIAWRAWWQTKKTIRQRQSLNEEQTLFYTDANRRKVAEIFSTPQEKLPTPKKQDTLFAEQLNDAIRRNMSNPNLKMEELGEEIGLGRVQLYRKVKAITGVTPVELLRKMRLQEAYVLLGTTTKTVAEIAYEVGFNTPGYFSKCFKEEYGKLPMDLRSE